MNQLSAGFYSVLITDANGCTTFQIATVSQPTAALVLTATTVNPTGFGLNNGSATASVSGGVAPYRVSWNTTPVQKGAIADTLVAGTYVATVVDTAGCVRTLPVVLTQPALLQASTTQSQSVVCFQSATGSATVQATGGATPYRYAWNTVPPKVGPSANNLAAGVYNVTVLDTNNNSTVLPVTITGPSAALQVNAVVTNTTGAGNNNGSIQAAVTGGHTPYSYAWNTTPAQSGATATNLNAGTYQVVVTDGRGCTVNASGIVANPYTVVISFANVQNVNCAGGNNGTATALPSGGIAPYTFVWNTVPAQTGSTATNLAAGTYSVTATDSLGTGTTQTVTITQPNALVASTSSTSIACAGGAGTATVTATGGTAPYTYAWNTAPVQTTATATGLTSGFYQATVTDAKGCTTTPNGVVLLAPAPLVAAFTTTPATCSTTANGQAQVNVSGGTAPYTFSWSNGQTTASITNALSSTYAVTVTDAKGCSSLVIGINVGTTDYDCDGIPNTTEGTVDTDGDGTPDFRDLDSDNDGISDATEGNVDTDGDGTPDFRDTDADNDGILDRDEPSDDCDGDGIPNFRDPDVRGVIIPEGFSPNNDGYNDTWEIRNLVYAPNNELVVVNRWGETVYRMVNYNNTFDGTPNVTTSGVSGDGILPEGTYYFLFYDRTNNQQFDGYVFIAK